MMSEEDEEILFDRSGALIDEQHLISNGGDIEEGDDQSDSPVHVQTLATVVPVRARILQTCLCAAFFGLGLCIAIPGPTLLDLQEQTNTDTEEISRIFTGRSIGYLFGSMVGGFLFDRINQTCLLSLSLLLTAIGTAAAPWCKNFLLLVSIISFQGVSMGFLDTGGNVLCLNIYGRDSGPYVQTMHFAFGLGAFVAPLIAEPFLSRENATNITMYENVTDILTETPLMLHKRFVRQADIPGAVTPVLPPLNVTNATEPPKPTKPIAADAKYLNQDPKVADGGKVGHIIYDQEKQKVKEQPPVNNEVTEAPAHMIILHKNNGTWVSDNDTFVVDAGQRTTTSTSTTTTTTTTTTTQPTTTTTTTTPAPAQINSKEDGSSDVNETLPSNSTNATLGEPAHSSKNPLQKLKNQITNVANTVTDVFNSLTKVQFAYLLIAMFILLVSFMFMFVCCCSGRCTFSAIKYQEAQPDYLIKKESIGFRIQILTLLFIFYFLYVGMEVTYGGLIMTFAVTYLDWSKAWGTIINSVFWGSFACGRLLAIPLAKCLTPAMMLVTDLVLSTLSLAGLVIGLNSNHIMLWFCTVTLGVGLSSIFPTGITWAQRYMQVTGKATAVFVVGSALGEMLLPMLTGFLFEYKGPMWLMYIMLGCAFFSMIIYIVMQNLATGMGERYERVSMVKHRHGNHVNTSPPPLHSIDSDDNDDAMEMDSVPLIAGQGELHGRKKKVTFNLHAMENGSVKHANSHSTPSLTNSKGSILKGKNSAKHE